MLCQIFISNPDRLHCG